MFQNKLDKDFTMNEISNALFKRMKVGKSPGNDGLTVEFYRTFWKELRDPLTKALREALVAGELSPSQKQSVIRLIPKKGKDLSLIKNWLPESISLSFSPSKASRLYFCTSAELSYTSR